MFKNMTAAALECGIKKERIFVFDVFHQHVPAGYQSWKSLLTHGEEDWVRFNDLEECKSTTAALLFSSGTTGVPKAGMLSHHNFIAQHTLVHEQVEVPWEVRLSIKAIS
jgi:long-subunit acyl-CoA synthetase (AMP-forming)